MQSSITAKVPNMLGDERMTLIICECGSKYERMASHKPMYLGFQCRNCLRHWKTHAVKDAKGQTQLWFKYYQCTCGSNSLNRPPKLTNCICEVVDLR
jgi:hypothetical protein